MFSVGLVYVPDLREFIKEKPPLQQQLTRRGNGETASLSSVSSAFPASLLTPPRLTRLVSHGPPTHIATPQGVDQELTTE